MLQVPLVTLKVMVRLTQVAKSPVESRVTQTGSVCAVAAASVGTITLLVAVLSIQALRTTYTQQIQSFIPNYLS